MYIYTRLRITGKTFSCSPTGETCAKRDLHLRNKGRDGQSETVGKASHPVKIYINDVAHAMTHHRSDAHASACQKVLRSDSRHALVTSRSVRLFSAMFFQKFTQLCAGTSL